MQNDYNIPLNNDGKTLKDFIPLVFAFFVGLIALSIYQNLYLYFTGVLDSFLNKSFLLLVLHHTGYTAIVALILTFLFNYLENRKSDSGYKTVRTILLGLLGVEGLLIAYYVQNYEILGLGIYGIADAENLRFFMLPIALMLLLTALLFHYAQKAAANFYKIISRMYPFTIILFSLFLATLNSDKKPINENKTQHLIQSIAANLFDFNTYEGEVEFPLLRQYEQNKLLDTYFNLTEEKPNIVLIVVDGLGADFIGKNARFKGFTPGLDNIAAQSLIWENFLSNSGTSAAAMPMIVGSLPFGKNGFSNVEAYTNRNTLYSILKQNGYQTSFNYGGNSALNHFDRFLNQERVDHILDKTSFGDAFELQEEDAAGVSLGYPDKSLFKKWNLNNVASNLPQLDVFLTLSTKNPYLIPIKDTYKSEVAKVVSKSPMSNQSKRLVRNNKEIFASVLYADEAIKDFFMEYQKKPAFRNTIFIITGSHNLTDVPQTDALGRYRVPFMIYSPLLKSPGVITTLASHADIAPSLITLLDSKYGLDVPQQVAWLGSSLVETDTFISHKQLPLFRDNNNIQDFILGNHYITSGDVHELSTDLKLLPVTEDYDDSILKEGFRNFKSVNTYVTENNKLIPKFSEPLTIAYDFSKTDMIWIESVFNGNNVDNAYNKARKLAFDEDWERSLLLGKYILSQTPRHADTEILMGRVYAWQKDFSNSEKVLKEAIRKYPKYEDGYAALLDTYFWAGTNEKALQLEEKLQKNKINSEAIAEKLKRAQKHISKENALHTNIVTRNETK